MSVMFWPHPDDSDTACVEGLEKYHAPYIRQAGDMLHEAGKFAGAHLDGDNGPLAAAIARTPLDLIESFTPPPGCPMPLAAAHRLWPEKTIQVNLPSAIHAYGPEAVRHATEEMLRGAATHQRLVVGVSEDIRDGGRKTLVELAKTVLKTKATVRIREIEKPAAVLPVRSKSRR